MRAGERKRKKESMSKKRQIDKHITDLQKGKKEDK